MRIVYPALRVGDLQASKRFYCELLGMKVLGELEFPDGKFTLCFVGYGDEGTDVVLELVYNWGVSGYEHGTAFGLIAIAVTDIRAAVARIEAGGGKITRPPGPMKFQPTGGWVHPFFRGQIPVIAFVEDPNGYKLELIERPWMDGRSGV